ncbi:nucleotide pyrophosphohydrolase [Serratia phage BF]|uniref:Nucleotide pyrophosphohydrolase n=1 Tax=Serratia phage BF TaxID=1962671 RepID=A0A1S6UAT9_9CAUD|nr:nucleotide pyrophosphohydrolase [Serratia phage BF]AQW88831.1 nucleotide pyrophosphohydrolase [Serratia phage BF]
MGNTVEQYNQVVEFMNVGSQEVNTEFKYPSWKTGLFRLRLINEELNGNNELIDSLMKDSPLGVLDGICDVLYVVYGAYATFGLEPIRWNLPSGDKTVNPVLPMQRSILHSKHLNGAYERLVRGLELGDQPTIVSALRGIIDNIIDLSVDCGFDVSGAFTEVHESNMSKFCKTHEDAQKSIEMRLEQGKFEDYTGATIQEVHVGDNTYYIIKRRNDGKILKGMSFYEPDLSKFIP